ncbi:homeobox-domain-containing protein [Cylindrobasidium torrendii FP15055 ss-10]|uniref:Homeobox-domain-containing protein n=1 Tax=Cylindrobasidium torrendii FP15055 ss-10 TaxID=1314674 RepID=A0A0D7BBI4_9AGAR|nr:homeobox-domain-containing protein [Cylindrobasidium torrendii FP15055 ss-10]
MQQTDASIRFPTVPFIDPSGDFRAFYPYHPNEVKHRKRTTSDQLKVLEGLFKSNTKPNGALRTQLAKELEMTPRGVQVWFQNRRAKEKNKAAKAAKTRAAGSLPADSASGSTSAEQSPSPAESTGPTGPLTPPSEHNMLRRGSLPINIAAAKSPSLEPFNRRFSVDTSYLRQGAHGYLGIGRTKGSRPSGLRGAPYPRPEIVPAAAEHHSDYYTQEAVAQQYHSPSADGPAAHYTFPPQPSHHGAPFLDNDRYAYSVRPMPSTLPGPLPSPSFSFGVATSMAAHQETDPTASPDPVRNHGFQGDDSEDDHGSSYDAFSRFGSLASVGTSDSSVYYPDCPPDADLPPNMSRRGSCNPQFVGMMSNLDMNGVSVDPSSMPTVDEYGRTTSSHSIHSEDAPTVVEQSSELPISTSSELSCALEHPLQRDSKSPYTLPMSNASNQDALRPPYVYISDAVYPPALPTAEVFSDTSMPTEYDQPMPRSSYYPYHMNGPYGQPPHDEAYNAHGSIYPNLEVMHHHAHVASSVDYAPTYQ